VLSHVSIANVGH